MKKVLVLMLCGLMLVSVLAGCANNEQGEQEQTTAATEENYWVSPSLTETDLFKGETYNLLVNSEMDAGSEEASSDPLEDAIYRRNDKLQNVFGVQINTIVESDYQEIYNKVSKDVSAGTADYDTVYQHMVNAATGLAVNG